jgi:hypothetical protein
VYKDIRSVFTLDEAETFTRIEPFDCSVHSTSSFPSEFQDFMLEDATDQMHHAFRKKSPHPISGGAVLMLLTIVDIQVKSNSYFRRVGKVDLTHPGGAAPLEAALPGTSGHAAGQPLVRQMRLSGTAPIEHPLLRAEVPQVRVPHDPGVRSKRQSRLFAESFNILSPPSRGRDLPTTAG